MVSGIWGKKIGMTQVFDNDQVVPVTVIDMSNWVVTGLKTKDRDGYNAIQVGSLRKKFAGQTPTAAWMKKKQQYFDVIREIPMEVLPQNIAIGQPVDFYNEIQKGEQVNVFGITKGRGFAGVVRRWSFTGAPASHGSTMGNRPGSMSFMRSQGRVIKGKRLPGHMGVDQRVMKNLDVVQVEKDGPVILVKGSVPGHAGSLLFIQRQVK
jgi:large subunit ribosomal protein L3